MAVQPSSCSYRDRTSEFSAAVERLKRNQSVSLDKDGAHHAPPSASPPKDSAHLDLNKEASKIGLGIHEAAKKVERLANLAKRSRSSIFDDPATEIQGLTAVITQDITRLNNLIQQLECIEGSDTKSSKHSIEHHKTVLTNLKERLMKTTNNFKEVLTARTENLKRNENRKQLYTSAAPIEKGSIYTKNSVGLSSGTQVPWAQESSTIQTSQESTVQHHDASTSTHLRRRTGGATSFSPMQTQLQIEQEVMPVREYRRTSSALQAVESTIAELSGMFTQVATMVSQQSELAIRIDDNMEETLTNVEGAQGALLKYLHQVSSNRGLIIKIFIVLVIVLLIFIFLIA